MAELSLKDRLTSELKDSMKSRDSLKVSVIRMLRSSIKNKEIERGKGQSLTDQEVMEVISTAIKQRQEAIDLYIQGGRKDLEEKEKNEVNILKTYLPTPLTEGELEHIIRETVEETGAGSNRDFGKVMKATMPKVVGRAEGALVSRLVKKILG